MYKSKRNRDTGMVYVSCQCGYSFKSFNESETLCSTCKVKKSKEKEGLAKLETENAKFRLHFDEQSPEKNTCSKEYALKAHERFMRHNPEQTALTSVKTVKLNGKFYMMQSVVLEDYTYISINEC